MGNNAPPLTPQIIDKKQLPLHCPLENQSSWNLHPRIYLSFKKGEATCPYCGTRYKLKVE